MLDVQILSAAIASRDAYERVAPFIKETDLTPPVQFWWTQLRAWYERDTSARSADRTLLGQFGENSLRAAKHRDTLLGVLRDLPEPASPENTAQIALALRRFNVRV